MTPAPDAHADGGQMQDGVGTWSVGITRSTWAAVRDWAMRPCSSGPRPGPEHQRAGTDHRQLAQRRQLHALLRGRQQRPVLRSENIAITNNRFGRQLPVRAAGINVPITQSGNVWPIQGIPENSHRYSRYSVDGDQASLASVAEGTTPGHIDDSGLGLARDRK